jgi:hypothetical protein
MMRVLLSDRVPLDIHGLLGCESCHEWMLAAKIWAMSLNLPGKREMVKLLSPDNLTLLQTTGRDYPVLPTNWPNCPGANPQTYPEPSIL